MSEDQKEIRAKMSSLENIRILLEEARVHARSMESIEGEHIQARIMVTLRAVNREIVRLRDSRGKGDRYER